MGLPVRQNFCSHVNAKCKRTKKTDVKTAPETHLTMRLMCFKGGICTLSVWLDFIIFCWNTYQTYLLVFWELLVSKAPVLFSLTGWRWVMQLHENQPPLHILFIYFFCSCFGLIFTENRGQKQQENQAALTGRTRPEPEIFPHIAQKYGGTSMETLHISQKKSNWHHPISL